MDASSTTIGPSADCPNKVLLRAVSLGSSQATAPRRTINRTRSSFSAGDRSKKVRFAPRPKVNIFYKHDNTDGQLWFDKNDFRDNKKALEEQGKQWQAQGYDVLLQDAYTNPNREHLDNYVQMPGDAYMRGAEYWLCEKLYKERSVARRRAVQNVIEEEVQMKMDKDSSPEEITQELAALYIKLSQPAQDFAKRMGQADELGEKLGENPELPLYITQNACPASKNAVVGVPLAVGSSLIRLVSSMATAMGA